MPLSSLSSCLGLQALWDFDMSSKLQPCDSRTNRGPHVKSVPSTRLVNTKSSNLLYAFPKHRLPFQMSSVLSLPASLSENPTWFLQAFGNGSRTPVDFSLN